MLIVSGSAEGALADPEAPLSVRGDGIAPSSVAVEFEFGGARGVDNDAMRFAGETEARGEAEAEAATAAERSRFSTKRFPRKIGIGKTKK